MSARILLLCCILSGLATTARAQFAVPPNPNQFTKRNLGESGGGSSGNASVNANVPTPKTIVINYLAVSPLRQWTNTEGKQMLARLLAFSTPTEGEDGPVEVIREGKVRFLLTGGKESIDYPLTNLSQADQKDIKSIAQAAAGGPPKVEAPETEEDGKAPEKAE